MSKSCRLTICEPTTNNADAFIAAVCDSKELHYPWVNPPSNHHDYQAYLTKISTDRNYGFLMRVDLMQ